MMRCHMLCCCCLLTAVLLCLLIRESTFLHVRLPACLSASMSTSQSASQPANQSSRSFALTVSIRMTLTLTLIFTHTTLMPLSPLVSTFHVRMMMVVPHAMFAQTAQSPDFSFSTFIVFHSQHFGVLHICPCEALFFTRKRCNGHPS